MGGTSQREPKDLLEPAKILAVLPSEKWGVTLRGVKPGQPVHAFRAKAIGLAGIFHTQLDQTDFTEDTEPRPQSSPRGQGVWLRELGSKLGALGEKEFIQERVIDAG